MPIKYEKIQAPLNSRACSKVQYVIRKSGLVVGFVDFEIGLSIQANVANLRSLGANYDMTAVAAFPDFDFALCKNLIVFDVV